MSAEISDFSAQMLMGKLHATTRRHEMAVDYALNGVRSLLDVAPRAYLSLSFGKQSLCLAHLAQRVRQDLPMYFLASTETWAMYDYERVISEYTTRYLPNLTIIQTDRLNQAADWKGARDLGDRDLQEMCPRTDWDGWLWGLAMDESRERKITLSQGIAQHNAHPTLYQYADGKWRGCPIMNWGLPDLAAYIHTHDIPLLNVYRRYGLTQRTTARMTKKMVRNSAMALARGMSGPALSNLIMRFPGTRVL